MNWADTGDGLDLVAKRVDFLDTLADAPLHKPALVERLDHSRSTVDRAVRRLEAAGFVERVDGGFRTTLAGRLAAESYHTFVANAETVLDGAGFLGSLPPDCTLPQEVVRESRMETFETPAAAFEARVEPLRTATDYVALLPRLDDSRQLRLCHARVREGMTADLLVAPRVLEHLETEFPRLAADLATAAGVSIYRIEEPPPYALFLARGEGATVSVAPVADDATGLLTATTAAAVEWAEATLADCRARATDVTDAVAASVDDLDETLLGRHERRGPPGLTDIGVERVDATSIARRPPNDPATGWRVGFDLVDVYYGHPFERHHPGEGTESAAAHLVAALAAGENTVVVGPPGSGKSTLCRQVAARWVAAERGPVFHRATPVDTTFDRPDVLASALDGADGHALVVVEDGDDEATVDGLAELLERTRYDSAVSVLVESRASAWPPTPTEARSADLLRSLEHYRLGELTRAECHDAVAAFEAATGRPVPRDGDELFATIRDGDGPGDCYLLGYLLAAYTTPEPWSTDTSVATGLEADARRAYAAVAPEGPTDDTVALEVGLLAALLTASKQTVTPAALHTVAVAHAGPNADATDRALAQRRVDAAIDDLRGVLLFEGDEAFRTQHPHWAVRFLVAALDDGDRVTVDAFARAVSALLTPADDPTVRDRIESWLGRELAGFDRFETDVDATIVELFGVVRRSTALVPLFGTTDRSAISLPDACALETRLEARAARLFGWYKRGDLDRAAAEAEGLLDAAEALDDPETAARFTVRARRRLADVADDRGDPETAREHLDAGLVAAREAGDRRGETRLLSSLGMVELHADDYAAAERALTEAERVGEALGASPELSAAVYYLGRLHRKRGAYAEAEARLEESLALDRELGAPPSEEAATLNALGTVAVDRGAHERAEGYYRQALELQREANNTRGVATTLVNLGDLAVETGEYDTAVSCFEESLALARDIEAAVVHGAALGGLGRVEAARGAFDAAERHHRERATVDDSPRTRAIVDQRLGDVAAARGDLDRACDRYEAAFEAFIDLGATDRAAATGLELVERCVERGRTADARAWLERVERLANDADEPYHEAIASWGDQLASD
ncbi:tetratricopeptide repeat protein [Halorarius litoreus]|uniref:tetratricopeptide repeat protein n=1 Tax=Halorarius litoreus TaxID=2962676 RepID=UPI0020CFDE50|nr:tetratricopeptide repeat protein [Halorarius litoreus]